jgi:hypothetical protein
MAVNHLGRSSGLTGTGVSPASNLALTGKIISYTYGKGKELVSFKPGNRSVVTRYEGDVTGFIEIETSDMSAYAAHSIGNKYTAVTLAIEAGGDAAGSADGDAAEVVLSHAVLVSMTDPAKDNANKAPVTFRMRFELDWHVGLGTAPTMTGPTVDA